MPLAEDRNPRDVFSDLEHAFRLPCLSGETGSWNLPLWHWQPVCSFHEFSSTIEPPSQSEAWDAAPGEGDTRGEACPWASQHPCCHLTVQQMPGALLSCLTWPDSLLSCSDLRSLTPLSHHSRESPHLSGPQHVTGEARPVAPPAPVLRERSLWPTWLSGLF